MLLYDFNRYFFENFKEIIIVNSDLTNTSSIQRAIDTLEFNDTRKFNCPCTC